MFYSTLWPALETGNRCLLQTLKCVSLFCSKLLLILDIVLRVTGKKESYFAKFVIIVKSIIATLNQ